ncbi:NUDIX hydrolase [Pseudarthrobacter sp. J1738]|uniref:NUDIX hydrolase n=1 Tax=unclassified Pseudarthrobacter TaxID=2647000 RepID=UPI003D2CD70E
MPIPNFILELREKIGHAPLWLPGVTGVVVDDRGYVLLVRRADNGAWTTVTGILDPGEEPAVGTVREIEEETGVIAEAERILAVQVHGPITFPNGDVSSFQSTVFLCRYVSGEARVNDDESSDVRWFSPDELPEMSDRHLDLISMALAPEQRTLFAR